MQGDKDRRRIRATEMFCTRLAGHVGVLTPHCAVIEDEDGDTYFGSLSLNSPAGEFEVGAALMARQTTEIGSPDPWLEGYLSSVYALDLALANPDRSKTNFLMDIGDRKLRAYDFASADLKLIAALAALDQNLSVASDTEETRLSRLSEFGAFDFSPIGEFKAHTLEGYEQQIAYLMTSFVEPEPAPKRSARGKATRLTAALRQAFKSGRVLAQRGEDLDAHRVVPNVELATGLVADFVLRNGAMHVIETVDASSEASFGIRVIKDIALSALTIEQARITYGDTDTIGRLVYQASPETEVLASSALLAAEHQRIELINWASGDDQRKLLTTMATLAIPVPRKKGGLSPVNASTQHRFDIN